MSSITFFNLFANATFSLWVGLLIVFGFMSLFRVQVGSWKLFLLAAPFIKVIHDFFQGVPETSILVKNIDPFTIEPGFRFLTIGAGWNYFGPVFQLVFSIKDPAKQQFSASAGDFLFFWLTKKLGTAGITIILFVIGGISLFFVLRRLIEALRFERMRRKDRITAQEFKKNRSDFRAVDIYLSEKFIGTPFTGGVFKPYICLPTETLKKLSEDETNAVISHEMGHIRQFDIVFTVFIQVLGDFFWFIPGYRWLSKKIDRIREIVADQFAVKKGISGEYLASALIKLKEIPESNNKFILYSAFTREKSLLKQRIGRLLGNVSDKKERLGWRHLLIRVVVTFWIFGAVMNSTLAGNHQTTLSVPAGLLKVLCDYFEVKPYIE